MNDNNAKKRKKTNGQSTIYITLHSKQKIEQPDPLKSRRVALFTKPVNECGKERVVLTTSGTYT
jgi:hypothetical protein